MKSKRYTLDDAISLVFVGLLPFVIFVCQFRYYIIWLFEIDAYPWSLDFLMTISPVLLFFAILQSRLLHYCRYHRLMMTSVMAIQTVCYVTDWFPSILAYNLFVMALYLAALVGFFVSLYRLLKQITNHVRKIRIIGQARRMRGSHRYSS